VKPNSRAGPHRTPIRRRRPAARGSCKAKGAAAAGGAQFEGLRFGLSEL
jgi:hypothetical protein